ncbi:MULTISPECIES: carbohydrate ABC transporter permease [Clostridium]|uniref:Carbohydrate ABC transporter permease n=1 Tax=Clostridium frigoriphilum TaxID=443253 RepID=A0ABU7UW74_9CLOT|nr:carbohydrate ABC transporter permease [Clostridium sp. DSM 17811]MBU3099420.1 carbohydrate ABC transporter permease [Clostridium sp. DSM 17811]
MKKESIDFKFSKSEKKWKKSFTVLLVMYCSFTIYMLAMTASNSFKTRQDLLYNTFGLPKTISFESFKHVFMNGYLKSLLNSFGITVLVVVGAIALACSVAYGISKFNFKFKGLILAYFLMGMMLPVQLKLIPLYNIIKMLNLNNDIFGVVIIGISNLSLPVFILSMFFKNLPGELYEAGKIDGASEFRIFYSIMLPLARPVISAVALLTTFATWNDFFIPLVFLSTKSNMTLPLMINNYTATLLQSWNYLFAAVTLSVLPIIFMFFFFSEQIVSGIASGGVKE